MENRMYFLRHPFVLCSNSERNKQRLAKCQSDCGECSFMWSVFSVVLPTLDNDRHTAKMLSLQHQCRNYISMCATGWLSTTSVLAMRLTGCCFYSLIITNLKTGTGNDWLLQNSAIGSFTRRSIRMNLLSAWIVGDLADMGSEIKIYADHCFCNKHSKHAKLGAGFVTIDPLQMTNRRIRISHECVLCLPERWLQGMLQRNRTMQTYDLLYAQSMNVWSLETAVRVLSPPSVLNEVIEFAKTYSISWLCPSRFDYVRFIIIKWFNSILFCQLSWSIAGIGFTLCFQLQNVQKIHKRYYVVLREAGQRWALNGTKQSNTFVKTAVNRTAFVAGSELWEHWVDGL